MIGVRAGGVLVRVVVAMMTLGVAVAATAVCGDPPGDLDASDETNVVDVQCGIVQALAELAGDEPPGCLGGEPERADVTCDGATTVADVSTIINYVLGNALTEAVDADQNGCFDTCQACGDGVCDAGIGEDAVSCSTDCASSGVLVEFQLAAGELAFDPACPPGVAGTFNGFSAASLPLSDEDGDGIWSGTAELAPGASEEFKFVNCTEFENLPAGSSCTANLSGSANRVLDVPATDTVLEPVCFGSCFACAPDALVAITFQLDASTLEIDPANPPSVAGSFNGFDSSADPLEDPDDDGVWSATVDVPPAAVYEYKFVNAGAFESLPGGAPCGLGGFGNNRFVEVGLEDATLLPVCFGSCEACPSTLPVEVTFQLDSSSLDIDPECGPVLAGSFNGFSTTETPLTQAEPGLWSATVSLLAGETIEYKFVNCESFEVLPPADTCSTDAGGFSNRLLTVPEEALVLDPVCFGSCSACEPAAETVAITFEVDAAPIFVEESCGLFLAGSFNDFVGDAIQMLDGDGDGIYTATVELLPGRQHRV